MRILLINSNRFKDPLPVIPIGLCYIANSVEKAGHKVDVLDLCFSKFTKSKLEKKIKKFKPELIGISIRNIDTCNGDSEFLLDDVKQNIISPCKAIFTGPIVIGGASVGINGEEMLDFFDLQYAIQGDGERAFNEFIDRFQNNKPYTRIKGLIIRINGKIAENNGPDFTLNLNSIYPVNPKKYINLALYRLYDSPIQVQSKRGCELKCSYCTYNRIEGEAYRLIEPDVIANEIEYIVKNTGIRHIEFVDSTFNIPTEHAKKVLNAIIKKKLKLKITTMGLNPKGIDEELVQLLKKSGFIDVSVTLESCSDTILKNLNKNYTKNDVLAANLLLQKVKIPIQWYLLLGAPGETEETIRETFNVIYDNFSKLDMVIVTIGLRIYNGSRLARQMMQENNNFSPDNFFRPVAFYPEGINLRRIKRLAIVETLRNISLFLIIKSANIPFILVFFRIIFKFLFFGQPYWRLFIFSNILVKFLKIPQIISFIINLRNRKMNELINK